MYVYIELSVSMSHVYSFLHVMFFAITMLFVE